MGSGGGMRYGQSAAQKAAAGHAAGAARAKAQADQAAADEANAARAQAKADQQAAWEAGRKAWEQAQSANADRVQGLLGDQATTKRMIATLESKGHTVSSSPHLYKLRQREAYNDRELNKAGYTR